MLLSSDDAVRPVAYLDTADTPAGPIHIAVDAGDALLWLKFAEGEYARTIEQELAHEGYHLAVDRARTARARDQIAEYSDGRRQAFDLPLALVGSAWQRAVWSALSPSPMGKPGVIGISRQCSVARAVRCERWVERTRRTAGPWWCPATVSSAREGHSPALRGASI